MKCGMHGCQRVMHRSIARVLQHEDRSFDDTNYRLALQWWANDDVMLYGSIANGFKSGIQAPFGESSGWSSVWDLRIQQDIPGLPFLGDTLGDNNFRVVLDIDNVNNVVLRQPR